MKTAADKNAGLIAKWAKRYANEADPIRGYADLWQEGYIGLIEAVREWEAGTSKRAFPQVATEHIRARIRAAALRSTPVGSVMRRGDAELRADYLRAKAATEAAEARPTTEDEIIRAMGLTEFRAARLRRGNALVSASPVPVEKALAKAEAAADSAPSVADRAEEALSLATDREREYLSARFGIGRERESCAAIAEKRGQTRSAVSKACVRGIKRIREKAGAL